MRLRPAGGESESRRRRTASNCYYSVTTTGTTANYWQWTNYASDHNWTFNSVSCYALIKAASAAAIAAANATAAACSAAASCQLQGMV